MKQHLRFRGGYCPNRTRPIYLLLFVFLTGVGGKGAFGQDQYAIPETITPLQIGDTIPEWLWQLPLQVVNHPEGKETIALDDYRGKLIILDFWATWCGGCVEAMPKIHAFRQPFGDSVAILASTYEPAEKARGFLNGNKMTQGLSVTSLVNNMQFTELFPHRLIPHYVWINPAGRIETTTSTDQVTGVNMAAVVRGEKKPIQSKTDFDTSKPLFLDSGLVSQNKLMHHGLLLEGWNNGLPSGPKIQRNHQGDPIGFALTNKRLIHIYEYCIRQLYRLDGLSYSSKKLIVETPDTTGLAIPYHSFSLTAPGFGTKPFSCGCWQLSTCIRVMVGR